MPTPATAVSPVSAVTAKAQQLRDPDAAAIATSPERPADLRTVDQVDWTSLIIAALGPNTTLDKPLPQLLLRLGDVISQLTGNAEHLRGFVDGQGADLVDAMGSFDERLKKRNERRSSLEGRVAELEVALEQIREQWGQATPAGQPAKAATRPTVQTLNA